MCYDREPKSIPCSRVGLWIKTTATFCSLLAMRILSYRNFTFYGIAYSIVRILLWNIRNYPDNNTVFLQTRVHFNSEASQLDNIGNTVQPMGRQDRKCLRLDLKVLLFQKIIITPMRMLTCPLFLLNSHLCSKEKYFTMNYLLDAISVEWTREQRLYW